MGENLRQDKETIGTTSIIILPRLGVGQRTMLIITNTSTAGQEITLKWGGAATAGVGAVLYPGGSLFESRDPAFKPSTEEVWAVASAAGATIAIHERIETRGP